MLPPLAYLDVRCSRGAAGLLRRQGVSFGLRERCGGIQHVDRWPGPGCLTGALGQALLLLPAEVAPWRPEAGCLKMERRQSSALACHPWSQCLQGTATDDDDDDEEFPVLALCCL